MSFGICVNLCLELVADVCSCISGFSCCFWPSDWNWCCILMYWCILVCFEVFELLSVTWKSCTKMSTMMNSTFLGLDGGLLLSCGVNPLHFPLWHLYSTRGSFPQSLGVLIKTVPKLVVCILQPEQALHQRCWSAVSGQILECPVMDPLH